MRTVSWSSVGTAWGASSTTTSRTVRTRSRVWPRVIVPVRVAGATEKIWEGFAALSGSSTESTNMVTPRWETFSICLREASGSVRYQGWAALMRSRECSMIVFCARRRAATDASLNSSMIRCYPVRGRRG